MDVLVRYSNIHRKKGKARSQFMQALRQRVEDKLIYEEIDYDKVSERPGRILIFNSSREAAEKTAEMPGVKSASPTYTTEANIEAIKHTVPLDFTGSFGVRVNTAFTDFSSTKLEEKIGAYIQKETGAEVNLDNPDTWIKIDVRDSKAFVFTETFEGPGGLPSGTQGQYIALISGGIDSPVAAYEMMKKGAEIFPIYFYNKPISAEDHLMRFEAAVRELKKFNPSRKWDYAVFDMEDAVESLQNIDKGRMVLHRALMFEVAERFREKESADGIVTGESLGQKSSQTPQNLNTTSQNRPIYRPLLTQNKDDITSKARDIGTYEYSKIDSACKTISPKNPSTSLSPKELEELKSKIGFDKLVESIFEGLEVKEI